MPNGFQSRAGKILEAPAAPKAPLSAESIKRGQELFTKAVAAFGGAAKLDQLRSFAKTDQRGNQVKNNLVMAFPDTLRQETVRPNGDQKTTMSHGLTRMHANQKLILYPRLFAFICGLAWSHDLLGEFHGTLRVNGYSCSPIAYKDEIVMMVGGPSSSLVAFNRKDGSVIWKKHDFKKFHLFSDRHQRRWPGSTGRVHVQRDRRCRSG